MGTLQRRVRAEQAVDDEGDDDDEEGNAMSDSTLSEHGLI